MRMKKKQSQQKQEKIYDEFYTTQNWFLQIVTDWLTIILEFCKIPYYHINTEFEFCVPSPMLTFDSLLMTSIDHLT